MNREQRAKMMGEEKIPKVLLKLAIPAIVGMVITAIYNVVDTLFVSKLGTEAIGAVSVVYPLFMLLSAIGLMYGIGSGSFISRLLGENNGKKADQVASTTLLISFLSALGVTTILLLTLSTVLKLYGATETILPFAKDYGKVLVIGGTFTILNMTMNNMLRAEGSAKFSMMALLTGAVLNIILDPIFIFTFDMGVVGASLATIIAQAISTGLLLSFYFRKMSVIHLSIHHIKHDKKTYSEVYKIGLPTFLRQFLMSVSMGMLNTAAMPYGDAAIASLGVTARVFSLGAMVIFGFSQGFQPIAGFNYGARKINRLKEAIRTSLRWATIFTTITTVLFMVFAKNILMVFSLDQEVVEIGTKALRAMVFFFPLFGFQVLYGTLFQALGKGKQAALLSLSRQGIFLIPAILIMPQFLGLDGVLIAQPFADICTVLLTATFAFYLHRELNTYEKEIAA
ncbi:MAG: MATE family efflux transporter [Clostridia bacterium]|nr:MATE family efflux transporter [Clostridia bacterium]